MVSKETFSCPIRNNVDQNPVPIYLVLVPMDNDGPLWAPVLGRRHGRAGGGRLGTATGGGGLPPRAARRGAGTLQGGGCLPLCRGIWEIV